MGWGMCASVCVGGVGRGERERKREGEEEGCALSHTGSTHTGRGERAGREEKACAHTRKNAHTPTLPSLIAPLAPHAHSLCLTYMHTPPLSLSPPHPLPLLLPRLFSHTTHSHTHTHLPPPSQDPHQAISTTGVLNATTLIYARRAGITAAAGTRLALFLHSA